MISAMSAQGQSEIHLDDVQVSGNILVSKNTILFTAGLRKDMTIMPSEFPRAIKRLWQLGLFKDIQIQYNDETESGISITIAVDENPILGEMKFIGNKKIKDRKFEDEISLSKGQRLRPNTLHETAKKIKELYEEKGYLNAKVTPMLVIPSALRKNGNSDRPSDVENAGIDNFKNAAFDLNDKIVELKEKLKGVSDGLAESNTVLAEIAANSEGPLGWSRQQVVIAILKATQGPTFNVETNPAVEKVLTAFKEAEGSLQEKIIIAIAKASEESDALVAIDMDKLTTLKIDYDPTKMIREKLGTLKTGVVDGAEELKSVPDDLKAISEQAKSLLASAGELPKAAKSLGFKKARVALKVIKSTTGVLKNIPNEVQAIGDESKKIMDEIETLLKNIESSIRLEKIEFMPKKRELEIKQEEEFALEKKSILYRGKGKSLVRDIVFTIEENKKVKIGKIIFEGNESYSDLRLRWTMKETKQQRWYLFWRSTFDDSKFDEDKAKLTTFYKNHGYRDFEVLSDSVRYNEETQKIDIVFSLNEGAQYKFRNFTWEGYTLFEENLFNRALGISKGDKYNEEEFNLAVYERVQGLYMDRGYIYSRVEPQITPVGEDSLDIHFIITENHKVYIRNIAIVGNSKTRENVVRRQLRVFPGDVFNRERLMRSQREIWMLNFFSNVVPNVLPVDDDQVDLEVTVEEKPAGKANANVGFTQTYGMTGGGGVELPNFRGKGQRLMFSFNVGTNYNFYSPTTPPKYKSLSLSFTDPMVNDTKNLLGFSLFYSFRGRSTQYYYPLDFTIGGGSATWGRLFKWPDDFFRGNWSFQIVQKTYDGTQEDLEQYVKGLDKSIGVNITQSIRRDSRDRPEFTTQGSHFNWTSTISGGPLGGNEDFHKHILNMEWYTPTFWKFVLMSTFKIGVIEPLPSSESERSIVPFDERFIMGGNGIPYGNALRGYDDNRVGPLTSSGSPVGGNTLIKIVNEFRVPFSENPVVYGLAFAEMGNVWASLDMEEKFSLPRRGPLDLKKSAGVGVRFFMPMIGMLGFDLGYGFDDLNGDGSPEGWKTTITFGQQF